MWRRHLANPQLMDTRPGLNQGGGTNRARQLTMKGPYNGLPGTHTGRAPIGQSGRSHQPRAPADTGRPPVNAGTHCREHSGQQQRDRHAGPARQQSGTFPTRTASPNLTAGTFNNTGTFNKVSAPPRRSAPVHNDGTSTWTPDDADAGRGYKHRHVRHRSGASMEFRNGIRFNK